MNFVIDKNTKIVLWINQDPKPLSGKSAWSEFNPNSHSIVFSPDYHPSPGEVYAAQISNGITSEFIPKTVWNIETRQPRTISSWNEPPQSSKETDVPPLTEDFQTFNGTAWIVDSFAKTEFLKSFADSFLKSQQNVYVGQVQLSGVTYKSSLDVLTKLQMISGPLIRGDVKAAAINAATGGGISNIDGTQMTPITSDLLTALCNAIETNLLLAGASMEAKNRSIFKAIDAGSINSIEQIQASWKATP